jgi:hypothetical protein
MVKMLGSVHSRPLALKLPSQKTTVRLLLAWRPASLAAHRVRLLTVVATLACLRMNEVARLQVCVLWFDYLASYGVSGFEGTCLVHIDRRKNVTVRKGHYPMLGRSKDPAIDIVAQLRAGPGCGSLGWRYIGLAPGPAGGSLRSMSPVISAHEAHAGRRHGGHGPSVLSSAGKRLDPLGRHSGRW